MIDFNVLSSINEYFITNNIEQFSDYIIYKTNSKPCPRRLTISNLVVDVDELKLCTTLFGDTSYWFDLKSMLVDLKVDLDRFKSLLEMLNLNLISLTDLERATFYQNASISKQVLMGQDSFLGFPLKILDKVVTMHFRNKSRFCYEANKLTDTHRLVYRLSLLSDLKGLKYFFSYLLSNYSTQMLEILLKELELASINPRLVRLIMGVDARIPRLYSEVLRIDTELKVTEYYDIIDNLFQVIGGVTP